LHAGSLVAALASWLDARTHGGQWLVRIEDVDSPRTTPGATKRILQQLSACGLESDEPVILQSERSSIYQHALNTLIEHGLAYPCTCSRKDITLALQQQGCLRPRNGERVYPGTCRPPTHTLSLAACAWRVRTDIQTKNQPPTPVEYAQGTTKNEASNVIHWQDRRLGIQEQDVSIDVGDFVLKRADDCFTYQLAVVVDDAAQGITHVVRGVDLADNTARQILLQRMLGLSTPIYLHTPLVLDTNGEKLSKQSGAQPLDTSSPGAAMEALRQAARVLGLPSASSADMKNALATWTVAWPKARA
jgi:glutamyl-Q tRNA(Asp) synthetase